MDDRRLADLDYCYLTTTGRRTGRPHRIEIWFGMDGRSIYVLCGGGESDWVKNLRKSPNVRLELGGDTHAARGRIVDDPDEDARARRLLVEKYTPRYSDDLTEWGRTALPVAIDLDDVNDQLV